jgi:hypothetical protein
MCIIPIHKSEAKIKVIFKLWLQNIYYRRDRPHVYYSIPDTACAIKQHNT